MFEYLPVEQDLELPDIGICHTFGLRVLRHGRETEELAVLPNISTDSAFVLQLARMFNRNQLDPIHLSEVLEDLL